MRVLAIDHGDARAGLRDLRSRPARSRARCGVIEPPDPGEAAAELAAEQGAELSSSGCRSRSTGPRGRRREAARAFADALAASPRDPGGDLRRALDHADGRALGPRRGERPADALAAAHLLEAYLQRTLGRSSAVSLTSSTGTTPSPRTRRRASASAAAPSARPSAVAAASPWARRFDRPPSRRAANPSARATHDERRATAPRDRPDRRPPRPPATRPSPRAATRRAAALSSLRAAAPSARSSSCARVRRPLIFGVSRSSAS